ncbi:MAG TPA: hypothetical protein VM370_00240 [Candidatus Thermoplasmatota archaeon]|nr:hypothetical protein [Candidatus Thermoplasmatota archaeon]
MRALVCLTALTLLAFAAPAAAHSGEGTHGLDMDDLVLLFDAQTQSTIFSFDLTNVGLVHTGAIFGTFTLHQDMLPQAGIRISSAGLAAGETQHFNVSIAARLVVKGCAFASDSGPQHYSSDNECAQTQGATSAPTEIPCAIPDTPVIGVPAIAPGIPTTPVLPCAETTDPLLAAATELIPDVPTVPAP